MDDNPPTLGTLIRSLRARNGWTLKEMSEKTGIPLSTLAKVEHDRLTLGYDKLLQISQRLKIKMSDCRLSSRLIIASVRGPMESPSPITSRVTPWTRSLSARPSTIKLSCA